MNCYFITNIITDIIIEINNFNCYKFYISGNYNHIKVSKTLLNINKHLTTSSEKKTSIRSKSKTLFL